MFKITWLCVLSVFLGTYANAQRVKRKGVDPIPLKQPPPKTTSLNVSLFTGKWQETRRMDSKGKTVSFSDTLYVHFLQQDSVSVRLGRSMTMKGLTQLEGNIISLAGDDYQVLKQTASQLTLDDGDYLRVLEKTNSFHWEEAERTRISRKEYSQPVALNAAHFPGKWGVYRTQSAPGELPKQHEPLRSLSVDSVWHATQWSGTATTVVQGKNQTYSVQFEQKGTVLAISGEQYNQQFNVLESSEKELVIEQNNIKYFFKKLN